MATLKDIALEAGVSVITVSRVLSGKHPNKVGSATRSHVLQVAERLGYQPNIPARALREQRTYQFALVVPYVHLSFIPDVIQSLQNVAMEKGYSCLLYLTAFEPELERQVFRDLVTKRVDGVVWLPGPTRAKELDHIFQDLPVVQILYKEVADAPAVLVDQAHGAYLATQHLLELGHEKIGALVVQDRHGQQRRAGYERAIAQAGLSPFRIWRLSGSSWETAVRTTRGLLDDMRQASAIVCYSDLVAWGAMRVIHDSGLNVPRDLSLVGFDDVDATRYLQTPLTTVAQPKNQIGEEAMRLLLLTIEGELTDDIVLRPSLVIRSSSIPLERN